MHIVQADLTLPLALFFKKAFANILASESLQK